MATHLVDEDGRHLCPEAEVRDGMDDGEFWAHVAGNIDRFGEPREPDDGEIAEYELQRRLAEPCPECGQAGACAYDNEGRALIHVTEGAE